MAENRQQRRFGLVLGGLLLGLSGWLFIGGVDAWIPCAGAAMVVTILAVAKPMWLIPLEKALIRIGALLGRMTTPVLLTLVYVVVLVPTALLARLSGKKFLFRDLDHRRDSYWEARQPDSGESSWYRQF